MELNLRKADLFDAICSMDEENFSKAEKIIQQLRTERIKDTAPYPWALSEEELCNTVAESELNYRTGKYIEEEDMDRFFDTLK